MRTIIKILGFVIGIALALFGIIGAFSANVAFGTILTALGIFVCLLAYCVDRNPRQSKEQLDELETLRSKNIALEDELSTAKNRVAALSRFEACLDAEAEATRIRDAARADAERVQNAAEADAVRIRAEADHKRSNAEAWSQDTRAAAATERKAAAAVLTDARNKADSLVIDANAQAARIIAEANKRAEEIAGEAFAAKGKAEEYQRTAEAYRNIIEGYGTQYLKPSYSLLDELAEDFSFTDAGKKLKEAREFSARMVRMGYAAKCDYVEDYRRQTAIAFVIDAFNGKVDSILSKTKKDNYGTLEQRIKDAYQIVNDKGKAFRNAVITPEYLNARLNELKWACTVSELKAKDQEEQRQIRERMREEERARREYERAQREAAKEEEMLRKAMVKAEAQLKYAAEEERAKFEARLEELKQQLAEAEAKGQRALSMAQQTRRGNVYVISNIGSFGENVYKVGMTRRLEPMDRVRELGDASVPFPFDVHAIIESDDAPTLEAQLHQELALAQMNKVNPRKEFFKIQLSTIKALVDAKGLQANWTMRAEAAQYYETLAIEKQMQDDPEMKAKWEAFAADIANEEMLGEKSDEDEE